MVKKELNVYILAILCIVAIVAFVLFVGGRTPFVYVSESDLSGEASTATTGYKIFEKGSQCATRDCGSGETVICYQSEDGCGCPPCSTPIGYKK